MEISPMSMIVAQVDFYLVDPDFTGPGLKQVEDEGELLIGGIGVCKGYLNAPELTEQVMNLIFYLNSFSFILQRH